MTNYETAHRPYWVCSTNNRQVERHKRGLKSIQANVLGNTTVAIEGRDDEFQSYNHGEFNQWLHDPNADKWRLFSQLPNV